MHVAAAEGHVEMIDLLKQKAKLGLEELTSVSGRTPLHLAAAFGSLSGCQLLLEQQCSMDLEQRAPMHGKVGVLILVSFRCAGSVLSCLHTRTIHKLCRC